MRFLFEQMNLNMQEIAGLKYIQDYITTEQEEALIKIIDEQNWMINLKRRVQHYGYEYDYKSKNVSTKFLGALPIWLSRICQNLYNSGIFDTLPDQVIINEYQAGQGISPHIDCIPCFGETICSLSLGSACIMDFIEAVKIPILLEPRSLICIKGDARFKWKHGIAQRKQDIFLGTRIPRKRRISLTFRNIKYQSK